MRFGSFSKRNPRAALLLCGFVLAGAANGQSADPYEALRALSVVTPLSTERPAVHRTRTAPTPLPAGEAWLGFDKVQHFTFSFLFTIGGQYVLVNKADVGEHRALPLSAGISAGIGLAKEVYDERRPGGTGLSYPDLAWNAAGIAAAALLILL